MEHFILFIFRQTERLFKQDHNNSLKICSAHSVCAAVGNVCCVFFVTLSTPPCVDPAAFLGDHPIVQNTDWLESILLSLKKSWYTHTHLQKRDVHATTSNFSRGKLGPVQLPESEKLAKQSVSYPRMC